jgi:hypothetical protein
MKMFSTLFRVLPVFALALFFLPLRAQYNPPPPPDEQGAGNPPPPADAGPPPDMDQNGAPPADPNAPPPDPNAGPDQGAPAPDASDAGGDANFQTFYDNLSSQGNWVQTDTYGYVWQPNVEDPDWAPYTNGHWVYTNEGWAWVADASEPWGWATYHYGRWVNLDGEGWVWVPGYTWAPAWVSWRYGGGYCGWAPLPPSTFVGIDFGGDGFGFHITGDCDTVFGIGPGWYHFVPVGYIGAGDYRGHYANRYNNYTIINNTRNVTNIVVNSQVRAGRFSRVSVGGPSLATINAQSQVPVQRVTLARSSQVGNARVSGSRLAVFAPRIAAAPAGVRPASVAGNLTAVRVNRGTSINQPLAVNARVRPPGPSATQVQSAQAAERHASTAGVATASTRFSQATTPPLTTLRPHTTTSAGGSAIRSAASHPAATSTVRPESAFTGETASHENAVSHAATAGSPSGTEVRHLNPSGGTGAAEHAATPAVRHETEEPAFHPQAEEHASAPQAQHEDFHPQVEHASAPPVQHQDFHAPPQPHPSAPHPHPQAQASHPAAPAGHPGGKDDKDKDKKQ